jgi:hypothetical protein
LVTVCFECGGAQAPGKLGPAQQTCRVELWAGDPHAVDGPYDERELIASASEHRTIDDCQYANAVDVRIAQSVLLTEYATHCDDPGIVATVESGGHSTTLSFSRACDCVRRDGNRIYKADAELLALLRRQIGSGCSGTVPISSAQSAGTLPPAKDCSVEVWSISKGFESMPSEDDVMTSPEEHHSVQDCRVAAEIHQRLSGAHLLDNAPPTHCEDARLVARVGYQGQTTLLSAASGCECLVLNHNTYLRFDPALLASLVAPLSVSQREAIYADPICGPRLR